MKNNKKKKELCISKNPYKPDDGGYWFFMFSGWLNYHHPEYGAYSRFKEFLTGGKHTHILYDISFDRNIIIPAYAGIGKNLNLILDFKSNKFKNLVRNAKKGTCIKKIDYEKLNYFINKDISESEKCFDSCMEIDYGGITLDLYDEINNIKLISITCINEKILKYIKSKFNKNEYVEVIDGLNISDYMDDTLYLKQTSVVYEKIYDILINDKVICDYVKTLRKDIIESIFDCVISEYEDWFKDVKKEKQKLNGLINLKNLLII